jgi:hypothetical protein
LMARPMALAYAEELVDSARDRIESLDALVKRLDGFREEDERAEFTRLFNDAALILELSDVDLARLFKISRPTAGRWGRGESAPHPLGRKAVFDVLEREAKKKLRTFGGRF